MYVSDTILLILDPGVDGRSVVKMRREGEHPDACNDSEDSDCWSGPGQASWSTPEEQVDRKEETELESLPVLTIGSFARYARYPVVTGISRIVDLANSWRSLFFYLCTDVIRFAPLKSQGADVRAQYVQERTTPDMPPPCSPKAIYSLAIAVSSHARVYFVSEVAQHSTSSLRSKLSRTLRSTTYGRKSPREYRRRALFCLYLPVGVHPDLNRRHHNVPSGGK